MELRQANIFGGYLVFKQNDDMEEEVTINVGMMKRCVNFINEFAPKFQFFVFPGGTRVSILDIIYLCGVLRPQNRARTSRVVLVMANNDRATQFTFQAGTSARH